MPISFSKPVMSLSYRESGLGIVLGRSVVAVVTLILYCGMNESSTLAETFIIPALSVTGTYDSNVYYTPKSLLAPDVKPEDYYMSLTPQLIAAHRGARIDGNLSVGTIITRYMNNPDLDYTGINAAGLVNLKSYAYRLFPRVETLSVQGTYQYTPSLSAFGVSGVGTMGGGFGATGFSGPLDSGLITSRVSMQTMAGTITGGYRLTPVTSMIGTYSYTQITFGNQSGGLANTFFDTFAHTGSVGISTRLSPTDTVGTAATLSHYEQSGSSSSNRTPGGGSGSFTTITGIESWTKQWSREVTSSLGGGGILTLPVESQIPGERIKSTVTPSAMALISYTSYSETLKIAGSSISSMSPFEGLPSLAGSLRPGSMYAPGRYAVTLNYNLSVYPSYAFGAGPMTTHVLGANATGGITPNLTGLVGLNYAHGTIKSPRSTFDTVGITAGLNYLLGSSLVGSLTYSWLYFANSGEQSPGVEAAEIAFSKKIVMLSLSYAFNSPQFFRTGGFGMSGGSSSTESSPGSTLKKID